MKTLTVHWVEMRTYEFPNEAPTDNEEDLINWIDQNPESRGDWEYFEVSAKTRDWEIVS